jgi:DegV family protein with EDD domain
MAYRIVVDSSSDIPQELSAKLGIVTVPMPVYIDGQSYREGIDLFPKEFYAQFKNYKDLPKTSQPNLNVLKDVYEKVLAEGDEVIAIHLSSGLSSTCQTALMVRDMCSARKKSMSWTVTAPLSVSASRRFLPARLSKAGEKMFCSGLLR